MAGAKMTIPPHLRVDTCQHGLFASLRGDTHIGRSMAMYGEWSEGEIEVLSRLLRPGDVVVDAGANIGTHAIPFARKVGPGGRVYAFEPQPRVHSALAINAFLNGMEQIVCLQSGLGAEHAFVEIPDRPVEAGTNHGGVSLRPMLETPPVQPRRTRIPIGPLDDMLALDRLRLIKADVEEMELDLIRGAARTIRKHQPVVFLENNNPAETDALIAAMAEFDYRGYWQVSPVFRPKNFRGEEQNAFGVQGCANILFAPAHFVVKNFVPATDGKGHPWTVAAKAAARA